ncbi:MAG TPA: hypothetical protein VG733_01980 [Chthoniobacteraceae bacterium]|nr:hypothetical protein [Chthoniobacteraceae bacterium]
MKTIPLFLFGAALLFLTPALHAQLSATQVLSEAQTDYIRGDLDAAKERFQLVLEIDPNNMTARNYLRMIETAQSNKGKNGELEKTLDAMVIPHIQLKSASFDSVIEYLKQTAEKISNGKTKVNFVIAIPEDEQKKPVSLDLSDVPFTAVLHYISEQTGFQFSIDKYAITVKEPSAAPAPAPVTTQPAVTGTDNMPAPK